MKFDIAVLPGDGIGPEVITEGVKVLQSAGKKFDHEFTLEYGLLGGISIDKNGVALTEETLKMCRHCDAVLLGAVGGPKWDDPKAKVRPEDGLLGVRKGLGLFANLRPVKNFPALVNATNFKPEVVKGVDMVVVRELTGGLYFGKPKKQWKTSLGRRAVDTMAYSEKEIERILRVGFELARARKKKLVSVDKANVLQTSRLWRQIAIELSVQYPDVALEHMLVDSFSMKLIQDPRYVDVAVTENMFGDILTDEALTLAGSTGMVPSASLAGVPVGGKGIFGLYEPIHGSAPTIAGKNIANPLATILSVAMMLRYSLALSAEAKAIEASVEAALNGGCRTFDIMSEGKIKMGTKEMGDVIVKGLPGGR